jgi:S-adenosylmethionine decarboxylase
MESSVASYEGAHVILDLWVEDSDIHLLKDVKFMELIMKAAALESGATILNSMFHSFGEECGLTGLLLLAESHLSCHTFPEISYVAFDFFTCGKCDPIKSMNLILDNFRYSRKNINFLLRGINSPTLNFCDTEKHP